MNEETPTSGNDVGWCDLTILNMHILFAEPTRYCDINYLPGATHLTHYNSIL